MDLAAGLKGGQGFGAGNDAGFLPFLGAPDVDHDDALFLCREKVGRRRLAERDRRADVKKLDLEDQRRVRRDDSTCTCFPVAELRRNGQAAQFADFHALDTLFPAANDLACADGEAEGLPARPRGVENFAILKPPFIMHADPHSGLGHGAVALIKGLDCQFCRHRRHSHHQ